MSRHLVDSEGDELVDWRLVARDGVLFAVRTVPYDGQLIHSTENRPRRRGSNSRYRLTASDVVDRYLEAAAVDRDREQLLAAAKEALAESRDEPARSEAADFGGGDSTGVQSL